LVGILHTIHTPTATIPSDDRGASFLLVRARPE
jgi:hypothetical protein